MSITPIVIADGIADEIPRIFNDAVENERRGQPDFIANGAPESIVGQVAQAVSRSACRAYGAGNLNLGAAKAGQYERACRPYLDDIAPGNGAGLAKPFEGGQCAEIYIGEVFGTNETSGVPFAQKFKTWGPISGASNGQNQFGLPVFLVTSSGSVIATALCSGTNPSPGPLAPRQFGGTRDPALKVEGMRIVESCGAGGACGNPPPEVKPPTPIPDPTGPSFEFNPNPDIDIDIDVQVGPDGDIVFDIGTGPITIDPFGGGDSGGGGGGAAPTAGDPGAPQDTGAGGGGGGGGGDTGGDAPAGKVLTGVKVEILEAPASRRRFTEEVDRGVGYVYMGTPTEGLGLDPTGATVRDGQFFFAQKDYLTRWAVRANFGYNLRTTPYYKDAPE